MRVSTIMDRYGPTPLQPSADDVAFPPTSSLSKWGSGLGDADDGPVGERLRRARGGTGQLDMYEHAYAIDYGEKAAAYVAPFIDAVNWASADTRFAKAD